MRILLTAFEPFGGAETNITQSVLSLLPNSVADWAIEKVCLPVSFKRAPIVLREAIATYSPDLVIMLGQCPSGENIRLERFAINMMDSTKGDNDGYIPNEETIYDHQPLALQTSLPIKELVLFCTDNVLPVQISNSAGLYVCNRVYYEALNGKQKALFIHIPKNMPINIAVNTLNAIFEYITIPLL
ncbi:MAG: pyroglutamyl-peptidase I [Paludibacteraceae bacterium]|nr:pyroglutamyl-peptidase I [Paludibacteraceae bacterium]